MEKLHTREILDYEKSCRPTLSDPLPGVDALAIGDHVHWQILGTWMDGIVTDKSAIHDRTKVKVVRYDNRGGYFSPCMVICEESWDINFNNTVQVYDYDDHCHPPSLVVTRAYACIGQGGYNILRNDNEDFCRWCKSGKHTYLCINEIYICDDVGEMSTVEDGVHTVDVSSLDALNDGNHVSWLKRFQSTDEEEAKWIHGIVQDVDHKHAEIISFAENNSAAVIKFTVLDFADHVMRLYVYEHCHMPDDVIQRAKSTIGALLFADKSDLVARWCKLGIPCDSTTMDKLVLSPESSGKIDESQPDMGKEISMAGVRSATSALGPKIAVETALKQTPKQIASRVAMEATVKHATKNIGARLAAEAGKHAPKHIGARLAAEAGKHAPKHMAKRAVHGVARGGAAAAAIGVEAILLSVDMHLTYKSFSRKEITKDELHGQNIQNSVRSATAATGSVGGGAAGAAIGSFIFPGVGTVAGGIIGGIFGGLSGHLGGHVAGKNIAEVVRRPYENMFVEKDIEIVDEEEDESSD